MPNEENFGIVCFHRNFSKFSVILAVFFCPIGACTEDNLSAEIDTRVERTVKIECRKDCVSGSNEDCLAHTTSSEADQERASSYCRGMVVIIVEVR